MATKGRSLRNRRFTHWIVSLIAIGAMLVAVLPVFALPAAATPNPLAITITAPTQPPANAAPIGTNYSVTVNVTLNGSSNWGTTGGFQVPFGQAIRQVKCFANAADSSGHYYVNYVPITNGTGTFTYTEQTVGEDSVTCYAYDYTYGTGSHQYSATSNSLTVAWINPNTPPPNNGNGSTAVLGASVACPSCAGSPSGSEITVPLGSQVILTASMTNLGQPVPGATLYLSQDTASTATVALPASVQTGAAGTNTIYIQNATQVGQTIIDVDNDDLTTATATINWTGTTSFTLNPTSQTATIGQTTPPVQLTANFTVNGVAIQGQPITLTASGGGPNNGTSLPSVNTDPNGNSTFTMSDSNGPGTDTWTATTTYNGTPYTSSTAAITWQEPTQYTATLTPPTQTIPVNQPGALATVNASISPTPPTGSFLTFKVMSGPNAGNSYGILINGNTATWQYNDFSSGTGTDTVQATGITLPNSSSQSVTSNSVSVIWGGATTGITLSLQPSSAQAILGSTITFTAKATQANGLAAAGLGIDFTVTGPNSSQHLSTTTDNNGQAFFSYTDAHASSGQSDSVKAALSNGTSQTSTVTWVATASQNIQLCFGSTTNPCNTAGNATVGQSATVTALVTNKSTNTHVGAGVGVTFTGISGINHPLQKTVYTDANGTATFSYVGQQVSTDTIEATTPAAAGGADVSITWGAGNQLAFTQAPTTGTVGSANTYQVQLTSPSGPVTNTAVTFTVTGVNGPQTFNRTTNGSGYASFSYTGQNTGPDSIEATSSGVTPIYVTTTWSTSNSGGVVTVTLSTNASSAYTRFQRVTLTATVTIDGQPAQSGQNVTFAVNGPNQQTFIGTTGSSGVATWSYSGTSAGKDTITASVNGVTSNQVTVTWKSLFGRF